MRIRNPIPFLNLFLASIAWLAATPALALTYTFSGTINGNILTPGGLIIDPYFFPHIRVGDTFTVVAVIDPVSSGPAPSGGMAYTVLGGSLAFSRGYLGTWTFSNGAVVEHTPAGFATIANDRFVVDGFVPGPYANFPFNTSQLGMEIRLRSLGRNAISSEELPTAINLADWDDATFSFSVVTTNLALPISTTRHAASGAIESVTVAPTSSGRGGTSVPDAGSTLLLLGLAFAGLAARNCSYETSPRTAATPNPSGGKRV